MSDIVTFVIFLLIPFLSIVFCFVKDFNKTRNIVLNVLLILNFVIYLLPLLLAYLSTPKGGNIWSENEGGVFLWGYMILLPACALALVMLGVLKIVFRVQSKKQFTNG